MSLAATSWSGPSSEKCKPQKRKLPSSGQEGEDGVTKSKRRRKNEVSSEEGAAQDGCVQVTCTCNCCTQCTCAVINGTCVIIHTSSVESENVDYDKASKSFIQVKKAVKQLEFHGMRYIPYSWKKFGGLAFKMLQ